MKLKKIASLALAGIMAVSMLAGCKDNPSSSNPTNPETPEVSTASSAVYDALDANTRLLITSAAANSTLDQALSDTTATYWNKADFDYWYAKAIANDADPYVDQFTAGPMLSEVAYALKADTRFDETFVDTKGDKTVVKVYLVGGHSDSGALAWVANKVDMDVAGKLPANGVNSGVRYEYDYSISASVADVSRTINTGIEQNLKIVAVAIIQTATEV